MAAKKLDILLINIGGTKKHVYQDLSTEISAIEPPFWAMLTAGFVRTHGFSVEILDASLLNLTHAETAVEIEKRNPRIACVVVYGQQANTCTPLMVGVRQVCREIKQLNPDRTVMLTGWHPSALPERTMREEVCDCLAQGEGFGTLLGVLEGRDPEKIPGLWWRHAGGISHNTRPENIADLTEELGDIAWDLLPMGSGRYRAFNWMCLQDLESRNRCATMFTSLGCPYQCTFCAIHATFASRRIRYWSPAWVLKQIDILVNQYNVKNINLIDEMFIFNPKHYLPIAEGIVERGYDLNFCAFARVDYIARVPMHHLHLLKKAGFNWVKLGIESSSGEAIAGIKKGSYGKEDSRKAVEKLHKAGMDLCANFMFGLPGDTWDTMQDTFSFAFETNTAFPSFFCTMAPPGSALYDEAVRNGIPLPDTWLGWAQQGYEFAPLPTASLTPAEIVRFRDWAFDTYFTSPRYLEMINRKFGPAAVKHIKLMTSVKLKRKILGD